MKALKLLFVAFLFVGVSNLHAGDMVVAEDIVVESLDVMAPEYTCSYSISFTVGAEFATPFGIGVSGDIEITCTGTGTSSESEAVACSAAWATVMSCLAAWNNW